MDSSMYQQDPAILDIGESGLDVSMRTDTSSATSDMHSLSLVSLDKTGAKGGDQGGDGGDGGDGEGGARH